MKLSKLSQLLESSGFANRTEGQEAPDLIGATTLRDANKGERSFLTNSHYREPLRDARALAATVDLAEPAPDGGSLLRCPNPYGVAAAGNTFIQGKRIHPVREHDPRAIVAKSAWAGEDANIDIDESRGDGDKVVIGAKSGVWSIPANDRYFGNPAFKRRPIWKRVAAVRKLPELIRKLQRLEAEVAALRNSRVSDD